MILDEKNSNRVDSGSGPAEVSTLDEIKGKVQLEIPPTPSIKMQKNASHGKAERKALEKELLEPATQSPGVLSQRKECILLIEFLGGIEQERWQHQCDEVSHLLAEEIKSR